MDKQIDYEAAFAGCRSNLEAPLIGRVITPVCHGCKNLVHPENLFDPSTCRVFGKLPKEYWESDEGECPRKRTGVPLNTDAEADVPGWESEFQHLILIRGRKYFEEGNVSPLRRRGNTVFAYVRGAWDYSVEIDVIDGLVEHMECTCPYAENGRNCKHMAAVLFALTAEPPVRIEELPERKRPVAVDRVPVEFPWLDAVDHLPEKVVRRKLMQLAERDDALKERLAILYLGGLSEGQLQNWKADLQQLAFEAADRHGVIAWEDAEDLLMDYGNFLSQKLPMLLEANACMDAAKMVWIVLETAMEQIYDEPDGSLLWLKEECEDSWKAIFEAAAEPVRQELLDWFWRVRQTAEWSYGVDGVEIDWFFLTLPWSEQQHRSNFSRLAEEISATEDDGSNHAALRAIQKRISEMLMP